MLWDISRICKAITDCPELPSLQRLIEFDSAYSIMHNAYQAELIATASKKFPGAVRIPRARKDIKRGDFEIVGKAHRHFEIKTVHRVATIDIFDTGWGLDPDYAAFLPRRLKRLQRDAIGQVGPDGTLVAILWCDSAGEIVRQVLADREASVGDVFVSGGVVLGVRDAEGRDRWFRLSERLNEPILTRLPGELCNAVFPNAIIPLTGSFKSVTNAEEWISLGRAVRINNRATPSDYDNAEFAEYSSRPLSEVPTPHLSKVRDILEHAERYREQFARLMLEHPAEDRVYSYREIFSDDRFLCAFRWAGSVGISIHELAESSGTAVFGKAIGKDIEKIATTIFACRSMLCGAIPSKTLADRIVRLVSSEGKILPVRVLHKLTKGLRRLVGDELVLRSE